MAPEHKRTWARKQDILLSAATLALFFGIVAAMGLLSRIGRPGDNSRIREMTEINGLDSAVKAFRERHGEYPPDFGNETAEQNVAQVAGFLRRAFPKCPARNYPPDFRDPAQFDAEKYNPATALTFWLGGMRSEKGEFIGFGDDPENPFDPTCKSRIAPFYDFDQQRLSSGKGTKYYPCAYHGDHSQGCFIYLRAENGSYAGKGYALAGRAGAMRDARESGAKIAYMNPDSFQIRSFGRDGRWGATPETPWGVQFPTGADYNTENKDDITNFSNGTLEEAMR